MRRIWPPKKQAPRTVYVGGYEDKLSRLRSMRAAPDEAQLRPVLLRLQDRRLPLPRQILEGGGLEQRLVELSTLGLAHLVVERRVADDLLDAAAQLRARHWQSLGRTVQGPHQGSGLVGCCFAWKAKAEPTTDTAVAPRALR